MTQLITSSFEEAGWTFDDVSNYGIARSSGGVYTFTLWKNVKAKKGVDRSFKIKIDNRMKNLFLAIEVLEELMAAHYESNDFTKRLKEEGPITAEPIGKPEIFNTPF